MDDLRPAILDDYGLLSAIYWYTDKISERTGLAMVIEENNFTIRLDPKIELALFRISQEALTNITRHADATQAIVGFVQEEDKILMTITDDGVGFDPVRSEEVSTQQGWGLINMQERISRLGGSLEINAKPKQGTQLIITAPREV
jgi:signal transduction histidine kinase